jgi:hypothetical protein
MAVIRHSETGETRWISDQGAIPSGWQLERLGDKIPPPTEGIKHDQDKNRLELIHPFFTEAVGQIMTMGAVKYGDWNWYKGMNWSRVYGALQRHMTAWFAGESVDPESGKSHLWHAACCIMFLTVYEEEGVGNDDRPVPDQGSK